MALAWRLKKEGHQVWAYHAEPALDESMDGLLEKVPSMAAGIIKKPDFVLFDMVGHGEIADRLKKAGIPVFGASELADDLELKRDYGVEVSQKYGLKVPETEHFNSVGEAIRHVERNPMGYAIKLDGNISAASSFVSKSAAEMVEYLVFLRELGADKGTKFILQALVKGIEISTEVWFSKGKPILPFNGTLENKKLLAGDLGPSSGCETSAVFPYLSSSPKIVEKTLKKLFPLFEKDQWSGPVDINAIVSEKDHEPYFLEFTMRMGYSAIYALCAMIEDGIGDFLHGVATGTATRIPMRHSWGTSLRVSVPPYPLEIKDERLSREIYGSIAGQWVKAPEDKNIWLMNVKKNERGRIVTAAVDGLVGECTGVGKSLYQAWKMSLDKFEQIKVANKQGRIKDGVDRVYGDMRKLRDWKYDVPDPQPIAQKASTSF